MFPEEFIARIKTQQYINDDLLLKSLEETSPISIRVNYAKWNKKPAASEQVPWCRNGWYLNRRPSFTPDPLFHSGCYYPQEASGMFMEVILKQLMPGNKDLRLLDLCAAPGGKSTHISSILKTDGVLISNEVIRTRAKILADNLTRWGIGNTIVTNNDPSSFSALKGYFDYILVDAPCSGEGMFRDQIAVNEWSVSNTKLCTERQKRILLDVWSSLKEGGIMIYSTCTFNPAENEEQVRWLIENRNAESVSIDISAFHGIKEIELDGISGYGFYPGSIKGEGLFISVVRKLTGDGYLSRIRGKTKPAYSTRELRFKTSRWFNKESGNLIMDAGKLYSVPVKEDEFKILKDHLKIVKNGTEVLTEKAKDLIPSHEFILSELIAPGLFPSVDLSIDKAISYLRKDPLSTVNFPENWVIVKYLGVSLGLVKNIGSRINNYYPVDWRIRMEPDQNKLNDIIKWEV